MTVTRLRREMPASEFHEWVGFYRYEHAQREQAAKKAAAEAKRRR